MHDLVGTELLSRIWLADFEPGNADALTGYLCSLDREEEAALNQVLHMPAPPGKLEEAQHALQILSIKRLELQMQRLKTQLTQPNLDGQEAADIQREMLDIHRELQEAQKMVFPVRRA